MKATLKIIVFTLFLSLNNFGALHAQAQSKIKTYFKYLDSFNPEKGIFHWGHANASFLYILPGKINNISHGIGIECGLNLAKFFTKKIQFGVFVGTKSGGGSTALFSYKYTRQYQQTFNDNIYYNNLNPTDSAYYVNPLVKDLNLNFIEGTFRRYGISFKLPYRFFPLIKIFKTRNYEDIDIINNARNSVYAKDQDAIHVSYRGKGLELSFKMVDFFPKLNFHHLSIGFLYKQDYMTTAKIENVSYHTFLKPAFFEKFGTIHRFGFKISAELY